MESERAQFDRAIREHDRVVADGGIAIWVGAEPTFTDRHSEAAEWLVQARGTDKEARAHAMLAHLRETEEGGIVLRTLGRQYAGEERPRWSLGLYNLRDGPWAPGAALPIRCLVAHPVKHPQ